MSSPIVFTEEVSGQMKLKYRYAPHAEKRILQEMSNIIIYGLLYADYKRYFDQIKTNVSTNSLDCWIATINGYYDLAVFNWCMIFGSKNEPTHYKKLLEHGGCLNKLKTLYKQNRMLPEDLQKIILDEAGLEESEYESFHRKTLHYRNKNLIHREHSPLEIHDGDLEYPDLDPIISTLKAICIILVKLIKLYPDESDEVNTDRIQFCDLDSIDMLDEFRKAAQPKISFGDFNQ